MSGRTGTASLPRRRFYCVGRFETCEAEWREPDRYRDLLEFAPGRRHIVQGGGLSLSGASFGDGSLVTGMRRFNRILEFDRDSCLIRAEAGISLYELYAFLIDKGLCVAVQPGYPEITLGGCIAANVHGKNQYREGVFGDIVREITLHHPRHGTMRLSREENADLFYMTCGGYGLTGLIVSAQIAVKVIPGEWFRVKNIAVSSLDETVERMMEMRDDYDVLYSWNDLINGRQNLGRGLIVTGQAIANGRSAPPPRRYSRMDPGQAVAPFNALNGLSLPLANEAYHFLNGTLRKEKMVGAFDVFFPFSSWKLYIRAFGSKGFIEHQVLVGHDRIRNYLREFEALVRRFQVPICLATFKIFDGDPKYLNFNGKGISFAIHVPARPDALKLLAEIDALDIDNGATVNIIKDSRVPGSVVEAQYEHFGLMRVRLGEHDPERMFASALSRRLGL